MKSSVAVRFRWGLLVGALIASGIFAKDVLLGEWQRFDALRIATLAATIIITAALWAWLTGRMGKPDA